MKVTNYNSQSASVKFGMALKLPRYVDLVKNLGRDVANSVYRAGQEINPLARDIDIVVLTGKDPKELEIRMARRVLPGFEDIFSRPYLKSVLRFDKTLQESAETAKPESLNQFAKKIIEMRRIFQKLAKEGKI